MSKWEEAVGEVDTAEKWRRHAMARRAFIAGILRPKEDASVVQEAFEPGGSGASGGSAVDDMAFRWECAKLAAELCGMWCGGNVVDQARSIEAYVLGEGDADDKARAAPSPASAAPAGGARSGGDVPLGVPAHLRGAGSASFRKFMVKGYDPDWMAGVTEIDAFICGPAVPEDRRRS